MKLLSWNIAHRQDAWRHLLDSDADIALLQEAAEPPPDVASRIMVDPAPWLTCAVGSSRPWRTCVAQLTDRFKVNWIKPVSIEKAMPGDFVVSRLGTLAIADISDSQGKICTVSSMYSLWEKPHPSISGKFIYADASAHRLLSDLSVIVDQQEKHKIIVAGDLNILHGHGEHGSSYWKSRYDTVFQRMHALGFCFAGPQAPNGRQPSPWPTELPHSSKNIPTYHTGQQSPYTATRQLDFVFVSNSLAQNTHVKAMNHPDQWGPSDHCRIEINLVSYP